MHTNTPAALRLGALGAAALLALTACGNDAGDDTTTESNDAAQNGAATDGAEAVTIAIAGEDPYSYLDENGEPTGATVAVAQEIFGERMGYAVDITEEPTWGNLIPGLGAGHWNVVSAGMSITPDRCAEAAFGEPELVYTTAFLVEDGNPHNVHNFDDLSEANINVVAMSGAVEAGWMDDLGIEYSTVDTPDDGIDFVEGGRADVFALTAISLQSMAGDMDGVEVTDSFAHEISVGAHAFRLEDEDLVAEFNEHLAELQDSGEYLDLVSEFGFTEDEMPPSGLTAQELCEEDPAELTEQYLED